MAIQKAIQKSGILSPWRNPFEPFDRFYRRVSAITRAIMNFNGTQFGGSRDTYSFTGQNFELEILVFSIGPANSGYGDVWFGCHRQGQANRYLRAARVDENKVYFTFTGSDLTVDLSGTVDWSKVNRFNFKYLSATNEKVMLLNGEEVGRNVNAGIPEIIEEVLEINRTGNNYPEATYFGMKLWNNGHKEDGELILDYRFDEPDTIYQRNYANPLISVNSGLWVSPEGFDGQLISENSSTSVVVVGSEEDGSTRVCLPLSGLVSGKTYRVTAQGVDGTEASTLVVHDGTNLLTGSVLNSFSPINPSAKVDLIFTAISADGYIALRKVSPGTIGLRELSLVEFAGLSLENVMKEDWEKISKKSGDDYWVGDNGRVIQNAEGAL